MTKLSENIRQALQTNHNIPVLSDLYGEQFTGKEIAQRISGLHILFKKSGIGAGDKIAICAKNTSAWAASFLAALTYGAVVVPILHEFHHENITHLVNHSGAKMLFSESGITAKLEFNSMPNLHAIIMLPDFSIGNCRNEEITKTAVGNIIQADSTANPESLQFAAPGSSTLALINYTSGSTGDPKGVMLTQGNIYSNVKFGLDNIDFLHPGDGILSMLPLAHMYGLVFEFLFPLCKGCSITFLGRIPSPQIVLHGFHKVKPKLVITVPLVIEKIVRGKVFPALQKPLMNAALKLPCIKNIIHNKVRKQMIDAFGGNLRQLILGGAALSDDVEAFLRKIRFPFTIGYGMTECAPLVTYEWWQSQRPHSCGRLVTGMEARVESPDATTVPGVLHVRGSNVMLGYYLNEKATAETIAADGWLNTGDICTIDSEGYVYLRGRDKNMILGPSGQNIYPEEIESKLNCMPMISESVVVERNGKIIAIIRPDYDEARKLSLSEEEAEKRAMANLPALNSSLPAYSRVAAFELHKDEFEKTPKQSIRRFLYK